jgi:simple sugar transport system permease protein
MFKSILNKIKLLIKTQGFKKATREIIRITLAIIIAYLIAFIIIFFVSDEPLTSIHWFVAGPFTSLSEFGEVIKNSMPLIFAGIAACIILKSGQFNMFTEGAFYVGGFVAAVCAIYLGLPPVLSIIVALSLAGIVSGLIGYIPSKLKAKYDVNEFVSSIMMNFIILWIGIWLISNVIIDVSSGDTATLPIPASSKLAIFIQGTNITTGILIAIALTILLTIFLYKTKKGYALRMTGDNPNFARYAGIKPKKSLLLAQIIGIMIAGIGGGVEILSNYSRFNWKSLPGFGFDGFMVAIIAKNKPQMVIPAALFIGYMRSGANLMAFNGDVTTEVVSIIQGIIIILIASQSFFSQEMYRKLFQKKTIPSPSKEVNDHA